MRTLFKLEGPVDADAGAALSQTLEAIEGVIEAEVSAEDGIASIHYDIRVDVPTLLGAIKRAGYDARPL